MKPHHKWSVLFGDFYESASAASFPKAYSAETRTGDRRVLKNLKSGDAKILPLFEPDKLTVIPAGGQGLLLPNATTSLWVSTCQLWRIAMKGIISDFGTRCVSGKLSHLHSMARIWRIAIFYTSARVDWSEA